MSFEALGAMTDAGLRDAVAADRDPAGDPAAAALAREVRLTSGNHLAKTG
jgi:hypothetical protein